jgi:hypothetical protein
MKADMGGTELGVALQTVFENRNKSIPAAIFLLTDGEVSAASFILSGSLNDPMYV